MSFQPSWRAGATGWYPIKCDGREICCHCKGDLKKLHGLNKNTDEAKVMAFFAFGAGPFCLHCAVNEAWRRPDFFQQRGSNEYHSSRYDLGSNFRPKFPKIEDEIKKL